MMTIKELADSLKISKTAVRKIMTATFRAAYTSVDAAGVILISDEGCEQVRTRYHKHVETHQKLGENNNKLIPETPETVSAELVKMLRAQLDMKDKQIEDLSARLSETTAALTETTRSLQAAQALHAGTMKQLPDKKPGFFKRLFHGKKNT